MSTIVLIRVIMGTQQSIGRKMPLSRNTAEPSFGDWIAETVLLPTAAGGGWPQGMSLVREHPTMIPNYQRGISWGPEEVDDLVYSTSPVIGTVVLGKFRATPTAYVSASVVGAAGGDYEELADGLQRLSTGVCLLQGIQRKVLESGAPFSNARASFQQIAARYSGLMPIILHNHHQLLNHPRKAIKDQYKIFADSMDTWLDKQLQPTQLSTFADSFMKLMLVRPIALDRWDGFGSGLELMHTFLGLNTIRVDLGPVDLLRAHMVVKATEASWTPSEIEAFENDFTDIFTHKGSNDSDLLPFVNSVLKCLTGASAAAPTDVFPTWGPQQLSKAKDVDPFLEFVLGFKNSSDPYLDQVRSIGAIPFGIVMASHLRSFRSSGVLPTFLTPAGASAQDRAELHAVLCASLRSMFARKIGYQSPIIVDCLRGSMASLLAAANRLSLDATGVDVSTLVGIGWLRTSLEGVDKRAARTVFNAMLLPVRQGGQAPAGGSFVPLKFGRGASSWAVDHVLPEASLKDSLPGYAEGRRLRNLAPLPGAQNSSAKHAVPTVKLQANVDTYYGNASSTHPYCAWLKNDASRRLASDLDSQAGLQPNSGSKLGDARIEHIANELINRV
ncbi:DUF262 domain-containing protein [Arthrobacter sp. PAMC25284]|uniref:DUF262 domain-containing protein n=1 Tax=Arthrobacter sp. PAMC25284 TaxID=2861279 RepID=UPI001C625637|nr:DUF262 domain-containing protein [Arthrobacter sp. PAMC25284]QYF91076.1 DUF262 domain-containing protein [Arthrobacter sp. PAMC25284]